jgi:hypothetical protein
MKIKTTKQKPRNCKKDAMHCCLCVKKKNNNAVKTTHNCDCACCGGWEGEERGKGR